MSECNGSRRNKIATGTREPGYTLKISNVQSKCMLFEPDYMPLVLLLEPSSVHSPLSRYIGENLGMMFAKHKGMLKILKLN